MSILEHGKVHNLNCRLLFQSLPDDSIDLIIADPPYGIGYRATYRTRIPKRTERNNRSEAATRNSRGDFGLDVVNTAWIPDAARVLKTTGAMYLCTRWDVLHLWMDALLAADLKVSQRIVWDKALWGAGDLRFYGSQTEDILFVPMPKHRLLWDGREGNVWRIGRGRVMGKDGGGRHPTQKPVDLFKRIIEYSLPANGVLLDPFAGSGASLVAATMLQRIWYASESDVEFCAKANQWIEEIRNSNPLCHTARMFQQATSEGMR